MTKSTLSCLNQVATFLKVSPGKITFNVDNMPVRVHDNSKVTGFVAIIFDLLRRVESNLAIVDIEEKSQVRQWLEYALIQVLQRDNSSNKYQVLKELNDILSTRTFLASYNRTIADVVFFYILHHLMENLTYLEKEKFLNVSRWFDNLQQDSYLRQKNKLVDFSTNYLSAVAPAKH